MVWIVGDKTENGTESCSSFKQVLYFRELGFNLHDTMIFVKPNTHRRFNLRYPQNFEYMFVLSKGKPKTFNPIIDRNSYYAGTRIRGACFQREKDGSKTYYPNKDHYELGEVSMRWNVWYYPVGGQNSTPDKIAFKHPAIFPEKLAEDHIKSWSNEGDTVLDPFLGSGTTYKMALKLNRKPIGIEINPDYIQIAKQRLYKSTQPSNLLTNY